jgi:hypothetical protein
VISIVESNPHIFIERFIDAIKDGYVVQNTNSGYISDGALKEINLFKSKDEYYCAKILEYGETVISDYDSQKFLEKLQGAVIQKGDVDVDSLYWDMSGVKSVKVILSPPHTKEELDGMDWEVLKEACRKQGITGRDRAVLINRYLKATGVVYES